MLPITTTQASALARKHDQRVSGWALLKADKRRRIRHAFEIRHESFLDDAFFKLLRNYNAAFVLGARVRGWGRDVYVYFDNDRKVQAPFDAIRLAQRLGLGTADKPKKSA